MTITTEPTPISYDGNGVTTAFPVTFKYFAKADVKVTLRDSDDEEALWVLDTDYTLTAAGGTGTLTAIVAPATGETLVIEIDPDNTQEAAMPLGGRFPSASVETALDRAAQRDAKNERLWQRSLRVPTTDDQIGSDLELPIDSLRASKYLGFDATGKPIMVAGTSTDADVSDKTALAAGGSTARTIASHFSDLLSVKDFGAVGDGSTDDLVPLTAFFNALLASPNAIGIMDEKTYAISDSLPQINVSGVKIYGYGPSISHDIGTVATGTVIKKIGSSGGTMLTIAPTEGASAQALQGIQLKGITFNCNNNAAKGVVIKSVRHSDFDISCFNATTTALELNVATTLGEAASLQYNRFRYIGRQIEAASGVSLHLTGTSAGNPAFNEFALVDIVHSNALGILEENADNNVWHVCRVYRAGSGTATNSIEWRGGSVEAVRCRNEIFNTLSTTVAAIAKGTGSYTYAATSIVIKNLDKENASPSPTEETGATIFDGEIRAFSTTLSAGSGTFTSATASMSYRRLHKYGLEFFALVTITTNGTAASSVKLTLPSPQRNQVAASVFTGWESAAGATLRGTLANGSSSLIIRTSADAYPGGSGMTLHICGSYITSADGT